MQTPQIGNTEKLRHIDLASQAVHGRLRLSQLVNDVRGLRKVLIPGILIDGDQDRLQPGAVCRLHAVFGIFQHHAGIR